GEGRARLANIPELLTTLRVQLPRMVIDDAFILAVHHGDAPVLRGLAHGRVDAPIIGHQAPNRGTALEGREELEGDHAPADGFRNHPGALEGPLTRQDRMEGVIRMRLLRRSMGYVGLVRLHERLLPSV